MQSSSCNLHETRVCIPIVTHVEFTVTMATDVAHISFLFFLLPVLLSSCCTRR
jgi:hypothetical protein